MPCFVVQQATEYRRRIEPWKTKPVHRAHAADKRRRMTIGNQSIVGDWEAAHSSAPIRCVLLSSRGASAFSTGLGHVLFHCGATSQKTFIALALLSFSIRPLRLSSPQTG